MNLQKTKKIILLFRLIYFWWVVNRNNVFTLLQQKLYRFKTIQITPPVYDVRSKFMMKSVVSTLKLLVVTDSSIYRFLKKQVSNRYQYFRLGSRESRLQKKINFKADEILENNVNKRLNLAKSVLINYLIVLLMKYIYFILKILIF